ncbi:MAG TPA: phosphate acyltransferase PlsX [Candidatus Polarisedimenticolia bacterium]|nr:phosphate acyltransferase PlsX [Candidatus Polarisedimenticolia bacterium]
MSTVIALDAMGGDHAPACVVDGAVMAAREYGHRLVLVGRAERLAHELRRHGLPPGGSGLISVHDARDVIEMHEPAVAAIRQKKHSSIRVACHLVREGAAQGMVSAGNTGAVMVTAKVVMGTLHGIERPAVMALLPNLKGLSVWLDVGANIDPRPEHLIQFALMGCIYSREILGVDNPRVGILSVGEEDSKGNAVTKEVLRQLRSSSALNVIGNVEGRDIFNGNADVIVSDGFTGNVSLKAIESVAEMLAVLLRQELTSSLPARLGALLSRAALRRFKKRVDYAEYGGMPLLGVKGSAIICHGRSSSKAVKNAVRVAAEVIESRVNDRIQEVMHSMPGLAAATEGA